MGGKKIPLTVVSALHYVRLVYRSVLFVLILIYYISFRMKTGEPIMDRLEERPVILLVFWYGMTIRETAECIRTSQSTAFRRLEKAKKMIIAA